MINLSGHKLPTGYPEGRRMWLQVLVRDGSGEAIWSSGGWDPATGALALDPQLKVYEVKPGIWDFDGSGECSVTTTAAGTPSSTSSSTTASPSTTGFPRPASPG